MRFRHIAGALLVLAAGLLSSQSGVTTQSEAKAPSAQSDKQAQEHTKVGVIKHADQKMIFAEKEGSAWEVSNPETLKGHEGRAIQITGTFDARAKRVYIEAVKDMACGPKFCERQCKGKCGNMSNCDCPKK